MITKPEPKPGDPCPQCGGTFYAATVPTAEQRAAAAHHERPTMLPPNSDTADPALIEESGVLHTCDRCDYQTRMVAKAAKTPKKPAEA